MSYEEICRTCPGKVFVEKIDGELTHVSTAVGPAAREHEAAELDAKHRPDPMQIDSEDAQDRLYDMLAAYLVANIPGAAFADLETSDQSTGYGFWLENVVGFDGQSVADAAQLERARDELSGVLSDLNWSERGGQLGEDRNGYVSLRL